MQLNPLYVWLPRATSILSIIGSSAISYIIISDHHRKLARVKNRFMLFMSFFDVFQSTAMLFGTAALPRSIGVDGAIGNNCTCIAQAFFIILGFAVPLYNASLNIYYVLTICFRMRHERFSTKIEPYLHAVSIILPLSMAITFAARGYFGPAGGFCFVSRKKSAVLAYVLLLGFCFLVSLFTMTIICWTMIRQSIRMRRYSFGSTPSNHFELERRETMLQAIIYTLVFCLTYSFPFAQSIQRLIGPFKFSFAVRILTVILYPMQGFWNFVFYIRSNLQYIRNTNQDRSFLWALHEVVFNAQSIELPRGRRSMTIRRLSTTSSRVVSTIESSPREDRKEQHMEEIVEEDFTKLTPQGDEV